MDAITLYYLSGAPRVSTAESGPTPGPRSHILGIVAAAEQSGFVVESKIAGDSAIARKFFQGEGTESMGSGLTGVARDLVRVAWRFGYAVACFISSPKRDYFVYERYGMLQCGSLLLRKSASVVITESNGVFFKEAAGDRGNLAFKSLARKWELRAYRRSDLVVAVSEALRIELIDCDPMLASKVVCVPNGVDTDVFRPVVSQVCRQNQSYVIGWVGTLVRWQGVAELLQAVFEVRLENNLDLRVRIVGTGPDLERCRDLAESLLPGCVEFLGRCPSNEIPQIFADVDLAYSGHLQLENSDMYHSPLKLYEYMAMGVPPIASRSRDSQDLLESCRVPNLIFDSGDKSSLKSAVLEGLKVCADGELKSRLRSTVINNHSWIARFAQISDAAGLRKSKGGFRDQISRP